MRGLTICLGVLSVVVFSTGAARAQGLFDPGPTHVAVAEFSMGVEVRLGLPGRIGGLGDFFAGEMDFQFVSFFEGYVDYGGHRIDFDDVEFDLSLEIPSWADVDADGEFLINDPIYILKHLFLGGPPVAEPRSEECGMLPDHLPDTFHCDVYLSSQAE